MTHRGSDAEIRGIDILEVELPFKKAFKHALSTRQASDSVFIRMHLADGTTGYGEALPRKYVNDESVSSVTKNLRKVLPEKFIGRRFSGLEEGEDFMRGFAELDGAKKCCVEIALLDALGKYFDAPIASSIGNPVKNSFFSSGVISADSAFPTTKSSLEARIFGFKSIKVKVGTGNDLQRLKIVRNILGDKMDIRVDANCAWEADEAIEKIGQMRKFGISAVEQPVKREDFDGLKRVREAVSEDVIADESLSSIRDAERLAEKRACTMFNIRLSKCGGIMNALEIIKIARQNSIKFLLGCQVGESGVLSAAERHLACGIEEMKYYEGSYGRYLLREDVTKENMTMGMGGRVQAVSGPGLGVNVEDKVLEKYTTNRFTVE